MKSLINILYTPLDCPPQPAVNLTEFKSWITVYWEKIAERREHLKNIGITEVLYEGAIKQKYWTFDGLNEYDRFMAIGKK